MDNIQENPRMLKEVSHFFLSGHSGGERSSRKICGGSDNVKLPPVGFIIVDKNRIMRFANSVAKRMLGLDGQDYRGQLFNFFITLDDISEVSIIRENKQHGIAAMQMGEIEWANDSAYFAVMHDVTNCWRKKGIKTSGGSKDLFLFEM